MLGRLLHQNLLSSAVVYDNLLGSSYAGQWWCGKRLCPCCVQMQVWGTIARSGTGAVLCSHKRVRQCSPRSELRELHELEERECSNVGKGYRKVWREVIHHASLAAAWQTADSLWGEAGRQNGVAAAFFQAVNGVLPDRWHAPCTGYGKTTCGSWVTSNHMAGLNFFPTSERLSLSF